MANDRPTTTVVVTAGGNNTDYTDPRGDARTEGLKAMIDTMSEKSPTTGWYVRAYGEGFSATVFSGEKAACEQMAVQMVGKPINILGPSGTFRVGTILRASVETPHG